jgi:hypothetical protein
MTLGAGLLHSGLPESEGGIEATTQDYSSFRQVWLRPLSPLIGIVDCARPRAKHDESLTYSMRRMLNPTSAAGIDPDDHRSRCVGGSHAPDNHHCRSNPADGPQVVDDFREVMPVTQREMDVIETYLGALLDDMLKRME